MKTRLGIRFLHLEVGLRTKRFHNQFDSDLFETDENIRSPLKSVGITPNREIIFRNKSFIKMTLETNNV